MTGIKHKKPLPRGELIISLHQNSQNGQNTHTLLPRLRLCSHFLRFRLEICPQHIEQPHLKKSNTHSNHDCIVTGYFVVAVIATVLPDASLQYALNGILVEHVHIILLKESVGNGRSIQIGALHLPLSQHMISVEWASRDRCSYRYGSHITRVGALAQYTALSSCWAFPVCALLC